MKVLYFAWVRQKVGVDQETLTLPPQITTLNHLIPWLRARSDRHAAAFADLSSIRMAVNQDFAHPLTPIADGDEVAFFPPVTGGRS